MRKRIVLLFFAVLLPLSAGAQALSFSQETARLAALLENPNLAEDARRNAASELAALRILAGDAEGAVEAWKQAGTYLPVDMALECTRLLLSVGDFESAVDIADQVAAIRYDEGTAEARCLAALAEAFRTGSGGGLAVLAADESAAALRPLLYFALWRLTDSEAWRKRLISEAPKSPEGQIAASLIEAAPAPYWILPGRDYLVLGAPETAPQNAAAAESGEAPAEEPALQTGLFSRRANAEAQAAELKAAGFDALLRERKTASAAYWVVLVRSLANMNETIMKLKDAGFESFPVF
jgi:hypothetical protein